MRFLRERRLRCLLPWLSALPPDESMGPSLPCRHFCGRLAPPPPPLAALLPELLREWLPPDLSSLSSEGGLSGDGLSEAADSALDWRTWSCAGGGGVGREGGWEVMGMEAGREGEGGGGAATGGGARGGAARGASVEPVGEGEARVTGVPTEPGEADMGTGRWAKGTRSEVIHSNCRHEAEEGGGCACRMSTLEEVEGDAPAPRGSTPLMRHGPSYSLSARAAASLLNGDKSTMDGQGTSKGG